MSVAGSSTLQPGGGQLVLDNTANGAGANRFGPGSSIVGGGGRVVAIGSSVAGSSNPLGTATVVIDGGTLGLDTKMANVNFDNAVVVAASGTVEALGVATNATIGGAATNGVYLGTGQTLTLNAIGSQDGQAVGAGLIVPGVVSGPGGLRITNTIGGVLPGTIDLDNVNTFTGATTLVSGILIVNNASALGNSAAGIVVGDPRGQLPASLLFGAAFTSSRNVVVQAVVPGSVTIGNNANVPVTLNGSITSAVTVVFNAVTGSTVTLPGNLNLGRGGETIRGGGTVVQTGTNAFGGATNVNAGTLTAGGGSAIPDTSTVTLAAGTTLNVTANETIVGLAGAAATVAAGGNTLTVGANSTYAGAVTDSGGLVKTGPGTLALTGVVNYGGAVTVSGGVLRVDDFCGATGVTVAAGAALQLAPAAARTYAMPLSLAGTGVAGTGTLLLTTAQNATWTSTVSLAGAAGTAVSVSSTAGSVLTLGGAIDGAADLVKVGTGRVDLSAVNTYTGATVVAAGSLFLTGNGTSATSSGFTVGTGGTLTLDNTTTNLTDRVGKTAGISMNGGALSFLGSGGATSTETVGTITLAGGGSTINAVNGAGQNATLTAAALVRTAGATVAFTGANLGTANNQLLFTAAPTLTNGILPYGTFGGTDFAEYGANGVAAFTAYNSTGTAGGVVKLAAGDTDPVGGATVVAVIFAGGGSLNGEALRVTAGALLTAAGTVAANAPLAFGTAEAVLTTAAGATTTVAGAASIAGSGGLIVAGGGTLNLNTRNAYTGGTTLNGGTLSLGTTGAVGAGTFTLASGTPQSTPAQTFSNALAFNASAVTFAGSAPLTCTGNATLTNPAGGANALTLSGVVAGGAANLTKVGTGTLTLSGANTITAATTVATGILQANSATALGSVLAGTTVDAGATLQLNPGAATVFAGGSLKLSGAGFGSGTGSVLSKGRWSTSAPRR